MKLQKDEEIVKIIHHHPFPFIVQMFKTVGASLPFFFLIYLVSNSIPYFYLVVANVTVIAIFTIVIIYLALIYWLDKLVITNQRVVHIDWELLTIKKEYSGLLHDIQEVSSQEHGILSILYLFDYGTIKIETASSKTTILFTEAPDPDGAKAFLMGHIQNCRPESYQNASDSAASLANEA
ncbi:hypothetical protein JW911_03245 [Candidatus Peregrinibacteria bacterium]|nr:hypothetical protein [Candidatus Peregrinibacteria bacterium]